MPVSQVPSLQQINFAAGKGPDDVPLELPVGRVVVLVGPNNSGKSLALKELERLARGPKDPNLKVLRDVEFSWPDDPMSVFGMLEQLKLRKHEREGQTTDYQADYSRLGGDKKTFSFRMPELEKAVHDRDDERLRKWLIEPFTVRLDGRTRFQLVDNHTMSGFRAVPNNHLWQLWLDVDARERLRCLTEEAFGLHFVLDALNQGNLQVRMSSKLPPKKCRTARIDPDSQAFLDSCPRINAFGDGVQAYVGLLAAVLSLPHRLMLVDEPEAFLHPPHARRLGLELSSIAKENEGSLIVATHSADFLLGCVSGATETAVVRLSYSEGEATARALDSEQLRAFLQDPLLRSIGLGRGLFHRGVVVCEADADRSFYDEIHRRLVGSGEVDGDVLFLNAQNWQTEHRLIRPLRHLGVPSTAIVDLDSVNDPSKTSWYNLLSACGIPKNQWGRLIRLKEEVAAAFGRLPSDPGKKSRIKRIGCGALAGDEAEKCRNLAKRLSAYGLFLVPVGELESWLPGLGLDGKGKSKWLPAVFNIIGVFEDDPSYLKPSEGDVWDFLRGVSGWIADPTRRGMKVRLR